jgi:hypothetical protein
MLIGIFMVKDFGCPDHGKEFLSICLNELEDKLYEHCTISGCNFKREHPDRRKEERRK